MPDRPTTSAKRKPVKPTHKAVKAYYKTLKDLGGLSVKHEMGVRTAFQTLLADTAKTAGWTLVPEQSMKARGQTIIPDGTLRDEYLPRGYWEAKDTDDDLDAEIRKKIDKGYPLTNTIFEDTRTGALFQGSQLVMRADLTNPNKLAELLNTFYSYAEPDIEHFETAVEEFKQRVPELAQGLAAKIADAHKDNRKFIDAFDAFFSLCRASLNPNLSPAAVDEMLIQHLLTERLIRNIFENQDFTQQNVIAAEVEKVIRALTGKSFSRHEFLKSLDRFTWPSRPPPASSRTSPTSSTSSTPSTSGSSRAIRSRWPTRPPL